MQKPNILLITTDQQRFDTINALGNKHIFTPHLNWLVDQGITFTRCYADSPICMPSRATIMTGKHGYNTGLVGNTEDVKPMKDNPTLPGILTKNGYQTRAQGKMHFSPMRANYGFEHMELPMDYYRERNKNANMGLPKEHGVGENEIEPVISTVDETNSLTYWTVKRSIDFLETRDDTRPFFLWTSFTKPHPPFDPCFNYWSLYCNREVPNPVYGEWSEELDEIPQGYMKSTYMLNNAYRLTREQMKDVKRAYYSCITQIDYSLGLLFARMREMGLFENTWIIFTSDHGDMMGDHHMGAKSTFFEGSAHVPLIIRPPHDSWHINELSGIKCDSLVTLADIMPTLLSIAGVESPPDIDGINILDLLKNPLQRTFFGNCNNEYFAVIKNQYKYMWTVFGGDDLLFDIETDPYEKKNLSTSTQYNSIKEELKKLLAGHIANYKPELIDAKGDLIIKASPKGPHEIPKWPGFHSTVFDTDVLH